MLSRCFRTVPGAIHRACAISRLRMPSATHASTSVSRSVSAPHRRFSLVPSYKTQIDVHGNQAFLYFECHDIGDYDLATRFIASDTFLGGTLHQVGGSWLFWNMTAGKSAPLSVDHYYFP